VGPVFVVIGEAIVDLVAETGSRTFVAHPGGSPANVALGLARLGHAVTLMTRLGRDAFGDMIAAHLEGDGVRVDRGLDPTARTSLAVATLTAGSASYDFRIDWDLRDVESLPSGTVCLHTGSLATALPPGRGRVVNLLERERERGGVTISYDPNVRPALLGDRERARSDVERLVALSDVVKVSDEDLAWLYPGRRDEEVAREWVGRGPALVVVTRGGDGVLAVTAGLTLQRPARSIALADTVGAGDSFTAGLLDRLGSLELLGGSRRDALAAIDEPSLAGVLDAAGLIAAITCSRPGADPPTREEVEAS
jgi:fructokinase